jgi:hypothetical protein
MTGRDQATIDLAVGECLPCCNRQLAERGLPGRARIVLGDRRFDAGDAAIP